jgi:hypothetical protein
MGRGSGLARFREGSRLRGAVSRRYGLGGSASRVNEPREVIFRNCVVRIWPSHRYLETRFPDGAIAPAAPNDDEESRARAQRLGYGTDLWRMTVEHELAHTFTAEARGDPFSIVLSYVAHGGDQKLWPAGGKDEDGRAISLQELLRLGEVSNDILADHMQAEYGDRLAVLVEEFRALVVSIE